MQKAPKKPLPNPPQRGGSLSPSFGGGRGEVYLEFNHLLFNHYPEREYRMFRKRKAKFSNYTTIGLLFLLPAIIFISLFFLYPFLFNVLLGFQKTTVKSFVTQTSPFVGFKNYILLLNSSLFWKAFRNTLIFSVGSLSFQFTLGFLLSLLFFRPFPLSNLLIIVQRRIVHL